MKELPQDYRDQFKIGPQGAAAAAGARKLNQDKEEEKKLEFVINKSDKS